MSDPLDAYGVGVRRERAEVLDVAAEHDATRFGTGHHDGIDGRAALGQVSQLAGAAGESCRQILTDVAGLEKPVYRRVMALTTRDRLDEDGGGNERRPLPVAHEGTDGGD